MKRNLILRTVISTLLCLMMVTPTLADVLTLPSGTKVIEEYAFYGDTSIDEVFLPEGIEEIGDYAFAQSGLTKINLPSTLGEGSIADNAIDKDKDIEVIAIEGTDAYNWAVDNGFISYEVDGQTDHFVFKEYTFSGHSGFRVVDYTGESKHIRIPNSYNNKPVISVDFDKPDHLSFVETIELPETVIKIGQMAFYNFTSLKSISLPDSVEEIGKFAFCNCTSLRKIVIPNKIKTIQYETFYNSGLSEVEFSTALETIETSAFAFCSNLENITFPDHLTEIQDGAFSYSGVKEIALPENVSIGMGCFKGCSSLTRITFPDSMTVIPNAICLDCEMLQKAEWGDCVTEIGASAFANCSHLDIDLPVNLQTLGEAAFRNCSSLNITLPDTVKTISQYAFFGTGIKNLTISGNVQEVGIRAFENCPNLQNVIVCSNPGLSLSGAFADCKNLNNVVIYEGLQRLYPDTFNGCHQIINMMLPASITYVGERIHNVGLTAAFRYSTIKDFYVVENSYTANSGLYCHGDSLNSKPYEKMLLWNGKDLPLSVEISLAGGSFVSSINVSPENCVLPVDSIMNFEATVFPDSAYCPSVEWSVINGTGEGYINEHGSFVALSPGNVRIRATAMDGSGIFGESVVTICSKNSISGTVSTEFGITISDVIISATNINNSEDIRYACSNANGTWILETDEDATYDISYKHYTYTVTGSESSATTGDHLAATATLDGNVNNAYSFTMKKADGITALDVHEGIPYALANSDIVFDINAPGCIMVQLVVDGKTYESWDLDENGTKQIHRAFNLSKDTPRKVQFRVMKQGEYEYSDLTSVQNLLITQNGKLEKVRINPIETYSLGADISLTISWSSVNHATGYKVYFYHDGVRHYPYNDNSKITYTTNTELEYKKEYLNLFAGDNWTVEVVAIGEDGWSSSTSTSDSFAIIGDLQILSPRDGSVYNIGKDVEVQTSLTGEGVYTKLKVTFEDSTERIYLPDDNGVFHVKCEEPGYYVVTAYQDKTQDFEVTDQCMQSQPITISVQSPELSSVSDPWGNNYAVIYSEGYRFLTCKASCEGKLWVSVDGEPAVPYDLDENGTYKYKAGKMTEGLHQLEFQVKYGVYESGKAEFPVYSVTELESSQKGTRYVQRDTELLKYPGENYSRKYTFGSKVTIEGVYNEYAYVTDGIFWGFLLMDDLSETLSVSEGDVLVSENIQDKVVYTNEEIQFDIDAVMNVDDLLLKVEYIDSYYNTSSDLLPLNRDSIGGVHHGTVSFSVHETGDYYCHLVLKDGGMSVPGFEKRFYAVEQKQGTARWKYPQYGSTLTDIELYDEPCANIPITIDLSKDIQIKGEYNESLSFVECDGHLGFVWNVNIYDINDVEEIRSQMNTYTGLKRIAYGEISLDKQIFDPDAINHLYYLNMSNSQGHSALLLTDTHGNGFYYSLYQSNWRSTVGLSYLSSKEMEQFFKSGVPGIQTDSSAGPAGFDCPYDRWVDLIGIPERKAYRKQTYDNCLRIFREMIEAGGSVNYDLLYDNCDDYALYAMTGNKEIELTYYLSLLAASPALLAVEPFLYISRPNSTFDWLVSQAGEDALTVLH